MLKLQMSTSRLGGVLVHGCLLHENRGHWQESLCNPFSDLPKVLANRSVLMKPFEDVDLVARFLWMILEPGSFQLPSHRGCLNYGRRLPAKVASAYINTQQQGVVSPSNSWSARVLSGVASET